MLGRLPRTSQFDVAFIRRLLMFALLFAAALLLLRPPTDPLLVVDSWLAMLRGAELATKQMTFVATQHVCLVLRFYCVCSRQPWAGWCFIGASALAALFTSLPSVFARSLVTGCVGSFTVGSLFGCFIAGVVFPLQLRGITAGVCCIFSGLTAVLVWAINNPWIIPNHFCQHV